jgi:hypothetical protein
MNILARHKYLSIYNEKTTESGALINAINISIVKMDIIPDSIFNEVHRNNMLFNDKFESLRYAADYDWFDNWDYSREEINEVVEEIEKDIKSGESLMNYSLADNFASCCELEFKNIRHVNLSRYIANDDARIEYLKIRNADTCRSNFLNNLMNMNIVSFDIVPDDIFNKVFRDNYDNQFLSWKNSKKYEFKEPVEGRVIKKAERIKDENSDGTFLCDVCCDFSQCCELDFRR